MVKNTVKKMKVSKVAIGKEVLASKVMPVTQDFSPKTKSKKVAVHNGSTKLVSEVAKPTSFLGGNLKKRLRDENKFISDLLDLIKFPKNHDSDEESEVEGTLISFSSKTGIIND
jgi:hypothetical protein